MRVLLLFVVAACASPPAAPPAIALPELRHGHRIESVDGGLLAFGGFSPAGEAPGRETLWLGPGDTEWQPRADMNTSRAFFGSTVIDGVAYAIGEGVERYENARDRWVEITPAGKLPRSHFATAAVGREIFVLGGYPLERSGFFVVDIDSGEVRGAEPPPGFEPGDHFHFLAAIDGALHVVGGLDVGSFVPQADHLVRDGAVWRRLPSPPAGLWAKFGGQAVVGDRWYLFGEFGGHVFTAAGGWQPRSTWGDLVAMPATVAVGGEIRVLGGLDVEGPRVPCVRVYDVAADAWRKFRE